MSQLQKEILNLYDKKKLSSPNEPGKANICAWLEEPVTAAELLQLVHDSMTNIIEGKR